MRIILAIVAFLVIIGGAIGGMVAGGEWLVDTVGLPTWARLLVLAGMILGQPPVLLVATLTAERISGRDQL